MLPGSNPGSPTGPRSPTSGLFRKTSLLFSGSPSPSPAVDNDAIYDFVTSAACKGLDSLKRKFRNEDSFQRACRMYEVCTNTDPKSMFVKAREAWNAKQISIIAHRHAKSPFTTAADAATYLNGLASDATIYTFVNSAQCHDMMNIEARFTEDDERERAIRAYDVCKNDDPESMFKDARDTYQWTKGHMAIIAGKHIEQPFKTIEEALQHLKHFAEKRKGIRGDSGSFGSLTVDINLTTIHRFVLSTECKVKEDIAKRFVLDKEIEAGERMFEVHKATNPIFAEARKNWTEDDAAVVAMAHARVPFLKLDELEDFLRHESDASTTASPRSFSELRA